MTPRPDPDELLATAFAPDFPVFEPVSLMEDVSELAETMARTQIAGGHRLSLDELGAISVEAAQHRGLSRAEAVEAVTVGIRRALEAAP